MKKYKTVSASPVGNLFLYFQDDCLTRIAFNNEGAESIHTPTKISKLADAQLKQYFKNAAFNFNLPLRINGTLFQQKIWQAMMKAPAGKTMTYGELALKLKTSPRVIGNACRANPLPIIIPCHRIVGKKSLTGYAGKISGRIFEIKKWLLDHERVRAVV